MNTKIKVVASGLILIPLALLSSIASFSSNPIPQPQQVVQQVDWRTDKWTEKGIKQYKLNRQEKVWLANLEFCESRGNNLALNPRDLDNTPSYSNFQFKWGTVRFYADRYELLPDNLEKADYINWAYDYPLMKEIMSRMIGERDKINWKKEFPSCVSRLGIPPK